MIDVSGWLAWEASCLFCGGHQTVMLPNGVPARARLGLPCVTCLRWGVVCWQQKLEAE
jgi:hypothetical protein